MASKERGTIWLSNNLSILYRQEKTGVYLRTITAGYLFKDTVGKYMGHSLRSFRVKNIFHKSTVLNFVSHPKWSVNTQKGEN